MKALERIKEIEKIKPACLWAGEEKDAGIILLKPVSEFEFLLKAFKVMREIAIELQNQNLYRQFLAGKLKREDLKESEKHIDRSFNISMELSELDNGG